MDYLLIDNISRKYYSNSCQHKIQYGTAGFRTRAEHLNYVLYRMGILATIRSKFCAAAIGLMITASHNEESDNGVKLVDPSGEMLEAAWENIANNLVSASDDELIHVLRETINHYNIKEDAEATVIVGRDTRKSGSMLLEAAIKGIENSKGNVRDFGIITTPQLHYLVVCINTNHQYGDPTIEGYISKLSNAFLGNRNAQEKKQYQSQLYLDAANGVGAIAARKFTEKLENSINIDIFNDGSGVLNSKCGADYVKIYQTLPLNSPTEPYFKCISIDGDADRIIYYYSDQFQKVHLLDGDKIAALIITYFKELLPLTGLSIQLGLVQTAYANGASTNYVSEILKVPISFTSTGVKYLHHEAQKFDVGVYFEANGHGTVVFKEEIVNMVHAAIKDETITEKKRKATIKFSRIIDMINQSVGDALSDMLLVETILYEKDWNVEMFDRIYTDLPNKQLKVKVKDRSIIKTENAERTCLSPIGLQQKIDSLVSLYSKGRAFIRPSGTEDIVRVYAECDDAVAVNKLAAEVALAVHQLADGIGPAPVIPNN
ncbi:phosphoacetylglucosamine mutase [Chelonus insularis]|uniref:phosphoacetylglucosamine mutase n=1 Tax=Chelonus insularis TaxID=460826 RepID=UPI00158C43D1|nr:phosphoacetylglucosamine mutase [Chelonus insularis]